MSDEIEYWNQIADIIRPAKSLLEADPINTYIESATVFVKKTLPFGFYRVSKQPGTPVVFGEI